jgi:hypothetical protein
VWGGGALDGFWVGVPLNGGGCGVVRVGCVRGDEVDGHGGA